MGKIDICCQEAGRVPKNFGNSSEFLLKILMVFQGHT